MYIGPQIVTDGLVLYLDAANPKSYPGSGTAWSDLSGDGNNSTLTNGPTFDSGNKGSIRFDGTNDSSNFSYDLRSNWTYECWVKHDTVNGFAFLGQGNVGTSTGLHIWFNASNRVRFGMYNNDTDVLNLTTQSGKWYHYCFSYQHTSPYTKKIWRDGVQLSTTTISGPSQYSGTGTVRIAATYSSGGAYADGNFAIAKLYDRVLTTAEIQQNYNATKNRFK